ncbi:hypothetical protein [Catenuloplanes atrovinosus]|uniref:Uncharacterized protein n=1 Tax=Catenuloplanes atrovinosus TaxID=137266 RepID=A0AAE4C7M6_9ACTN|nr:hypothetical protein [Catenuloplanes atrovinosus]MDR7273657.1 hypothetical protein [Catenuloplanes atrovinosus]
MIELDVTPGRPEEQPGWLAYQRRRLGAYPLVVLLVGFTLGLLVGGAGVYYAGVLRPELAAARAAEAARVAAPQLLISRDPSYFEPTVTGDAVRASGRIIVSNAGEDEVVVHAVSAEATGIRMTTDVEEPRRLQPGGTATIDVTILFDCRSGAPVPASTRVLVETADGARDEVTSAMDLASAGWPPAHRTSCRLTK